MLKIVVLFQDSLKVIIIIIIIKFFFKDSVQGNFFKSS